MKTIKTLLMPLVLALMILSCEDKMQKAAREQKKTPWEIAAFYSDVFFKDIARLNIGKPEIIAKATEHIDDMIKYVQVLMDKGDYRV